MKKLMTLMLGAALACGTVAVTFAQDAPKKDAKKEAKKKAPKKDSKKKDEKKKDSK